MKIYNIITISSIIFISIILSRALVIPSAEASVLALEKCQGFPCTTQRGDLHPHIVVLITNHLQDLRQVNVLVCMEEHQRCVVLAIHNPQNRAQFTVPVSMEDHHHVAAHEAVKFLLRNF